MDGATQTSSKPILILLGPPGSGKGTQARKLEEEFGFIQLSTGDLLRAAVADGTDAGKAADAVMKAGGLVSDDIVIAILTDRLAHDDCKSGVVLDGFPRTTAQAEALDTMLSGRGDGIRAVISLEVDDIEMVKRVAGRFTCGCCGEGFHEHFKPTAVAGICDACGSDQMTRRADDNAKTATQRLDAYAKQTAPLVAYYGARGTLACVDAMGKIDTIAAQIRQIVEAPHTTSNPQV